MIRTNHLKPIIAVLFKIHANILIFIQVDATKWDGIEDSIDRGSDVRFGSAGDDESNRDRELWDDVGNSLENVNLHFRRLAFIQTINDN